MGLMIADHIATVNLSVSTIPSPLYLFFIESKAKLKR